MQTNQDRQVVPMGPLLKPNDRVVFFGDSLTYNGWAYPNGWVRQVVRSLAAAGCPIHPIPRGVPGDTSADMVRRFQHAVLAARAQWLVFSCGVNDAWSSDKRVEIGDFAVNVATMLDAADQAGLNTIVMTTTIIGEDPDGPENRELDNYNEVLARLAEPEGRWLVDVGGTFREALRRQGHQAHQRLHSEDALTVDGVHFSDAGETLMARTIIDALGTPTP